MADSDQRGRMTGELGTRPMTRQQLLQRGGLLVGGLAFGGFAVACGESESGSAESSAGQAARKDASIVEGAHVVGFAPVYVAIHGGLFDKAGLKVDYSTSSTGTSSALGAVTGGSALLAITGAPASLAARSQGAPVRIVGVISAQYGAEVSASNELLSKSNVTPESPIAERLAALKGAKVGIYNPGDSTDQFLRFLFKVSAPEIDPDKDLTLISLKTSSNILAAFERGDVDAICASSPVGDQAEANGDSQVFVRGAEVPELNGYPYMALTAGEAALNEDFDTVKSAVTAIAEGSKRLKEDPEGAKPQVKKEFATIDQGVFDLSFKATLDAIPDTPVLTQEQFAIASRFAETLGEPLGVSYEEAVDPKAAEQAAQALGA